MSDSLIQRARDIAADQFIRLEMKRPTGDKTLREWAKQIEDYSQYMRTGAYDNSVEVQSALAVLRSVVA